MFWGTLAVCKVLERPFENAKDCDVYNIDALVVGTEQTLFANLRAMLNQQAPRPRKDAGPEDA